MNVAVEGTEKQMVKPALLINMPGEITSLAEGQQTHAPASHPMNMSKADKSKVISKYWESRSVSRTL
jgi:hypothetical protein